MIKKFENALNKSIKNGMISTAEQPNKFIMNSKYFNSYEFIIKKRKLF